MNKLKLEQSKFSISDESVWDERKVFEVGVKGATIVYATIERKYDIHDGYRVNCTMEANGLLDYKYYILDYISNILKGFERNYSDLKTIYNNYIASKKLLIGEPVLDKE